MAGDPYFLNTALIVHGDGTAGSNSFPDTSPSARPVLSAGACTLSATTSKFGGTSIYFPQSSPLLYSSSSDFNLTITNWTWELFYYELTGSIGSLISRRVSGGANGWVLTTASVRALINGAGFEGQQSWVTPSFNTWHHLAWVKNGTTLSIFVDGILVSTKTGVSSFYDSGGNLNFGQADQSSENRFKGYMDDIRWTPNVARYTANFTPPTIPHPDGAGEINGIIYDDTATLCSRTVRAYARDTGAKVGTAVSDAITGRYRLWTSRNTPCTVVFFDDEVGVSYNALVLDRVPPQT